MMLLLIKYLSHVLPYRIFILVTLNHIHTHAWYFHQSTTQSTITYTLQHYILNSTTHPWEGIAVPHMKNGTIVWYMSVYHITPFHHVQCFGKNRIHHHYGEEHSLLKILANSVSHKTRTAFGKAFPKTFVSMYVLNKQSFCCSHNKIIELFITYG